MYRVIIVAALMTFSGCLFNVPGLSGSTTDGDADSDGDGDGDGDGGCEPGPEVCNGLDDNCNGQIDEGFDLLNDQAHCGACNNPCPSSPPQGSSSCGDGQCELTCDTDFADCNGNDTDGCESSLSSPSSCGGCDVVCVDPTPLCQDLSGVGFDCVASCDSPLIPCDGSCVDTSSDPRHCGACGSACPVPDNAAPICGSGRCGFRCDEGFEDCDTERATGCETSLRTLDDCGECGELCKRPNATTSCSTGICEHVACDGGYDSCDGDVTSGCETSIHTLSDCGACDESCDLYRATASCDTGTCVIESCSPRWDDCNSDDSDGCETNLWSDVDNCGECSSVCGDSDVCDSGGCVPLCGPPCSCSATCSTSEACTCTDGCICDDLTCDSYCEVSCGGEGTVCIVDASNVVDMDPFHCEEGATCTVTVTVGDMDRTAVCDGAGTSCEIDCSSADDCELDCTNGAACLIECGEGDCNFTSCSGDAERCGNTIVCNRSCP